MNFQPTKSLSAKLVHAVSFALFLGIFALVFLVAISDLSFNAKVSGFGAAFLAFGGVYYWLYRFNEKRSTVTRKEFLSESKLNAVLSRRANASDNDASNFFAFSDSSTRLAEDLEAKVAALGEMRVLLGSALGLADSFRMVSSQISEFVPFATCILFQPSETRQKLFVAKAVGEMAEEFEHLAFEADSGFAAHVFQTRKSAYDENLRIDRASLPDFLQDKFNCAVAVPLIKNGELFAILSFYAHESDAYNKDSVYFLEKLSAPTSDFLHQSLTLERNQANALTDSLTQLPNERAFCLILEQQIAECHRFRGTRTFSVLNFDIENFSEINRKFGHLAGDRVLSSVAFLVKQQLRQMDVIARSHGDEFLILFPTVDVEAARFIAGRICETVASCSFDVAENKSIRVKLNFGVAEFLVHGETLDQLVRAVNFDRKLRKVSTPIFSNPNPNGQVLQFQPRRQFDN